MSERKRIIIGLAAEVLFAVLPLVVVFMVVMHAGHGEKFFSSPEWSFGASILFGQTLVKFITGFSRGGATAADPIGFTVALLVVFGLVPSLFVLTMTLQYTEVGKDPALWLRIAQLVLFALSAIVYMLLGTVSEEWHRKFHKNQPS
jgi:hypothetical protein